MRPMSTSIRDSRKRRLRRSTTPASRRCMAEECGGQGADAVANRLIR